MKKSKKIVALALSTFSLAQPAFQSCYAMSNGEDQSMLQLEGEEAKKTRKDFLKYVQSIISNTSVDTPSKIYKAFKEEAEPFKGLQFDHQPWQWLLYIIERRLDPGHYELYLNAKRKSDESGEPFTFDDDLHDELLCYGFTKDEIKIVDELLSKSRDLHLKEEQDLKRKEAQIRKDFLKCLQSIISNTSVDTPSKIYKAFKEEAEPFKDLQFDHKSWQWLLYNIECDLDPEHYEFYLNAKRKSDDSGEPFTFDDDLHELFLEYGFTEDEIEIVDELLSKSRCLHLKEEQDLKRKEAQIRKDFSKCWQSIISDENINTSSEIYEDFMARTRRFINLQLDGELFHDLLIRMEVELFDPEDYLNAKRKSEESREPLTYDDDLRKLFLKYGFSETDIKKAYELLSKSRDLYLKEKKAILKAKPKFLKCLQDIISDKSVNTSSEIYEAFKTRTQQFKNLQPGHRPWELLLYNIEFDLEPLAHECDLCKEIRFEKSGKIFTFSRVDPVFHSICLSCGFTEDEIKIVDKLLSKARDLYLEEKKANKEEIRKYWEESKRFHEEAVKRDAEARRREEEARIKAAEARKRNGAEAIALMNSAVESTNITLSSLRECFRSQILNKFLDSDICDVKKFVYDILDILTYDDKLNNYDYERDLSKKLEGLSENDRATIDKFLLKAKDAYPLHIIEREKRYAEEKAKKEAEEKARKEAEEKAKKEAEEKAKKEAEEKAKKEAEEKAKKEAEEKAKKEAEEKAKKEAEEKAKKEAEEKAKAKAEEKARYEAEEKARKEAEEKARKEAKAKAEEKARYEAEWKAIQFIVDRIQELPATENITSKSILENLKAIARKREIAPLRRDLYYVCENFPKISEFWEEGSLGKITGEAFKALKALWEKYRKIQAEEKAKKEAEEKARKEAEEKAKKEAEEKAKKEAEEKARKKAEAGQELAWRLKNFERNPNTPLSEFKKFVNTIYCDLNSKYPTFRLELSTLQSWLTNDYFDSSYDFDFKLYFGFNSDLCGAVKKFVGEAKARQNTERRKEIQKRAKRSIEAKEAARRGKKGGGRK